MGQEEEEKEEISSINFEQGFWAPKGKRKKSCSSWEVQPFLGEEGEMIRFSRRLLLSKNHLAKRWKGLEKLTPKKPEQPFSSEADCQMSERARTRDKRKKMARTCWTWRGKNVLLGKLLRTEKKQSIHRTTVSMVGKTSLGDYQNKQTQSSGAVLNPR